MTITSFIIFIILNHSSPCLILLSLSALFPFSFQFLTMLAFLPSFSPPPLTPQSSLSMTLLPDDILSSSNPVSLHLTPAILVISIPFSSPFWMSSYPYLLLSLVSPFGTFSSLPYYPASFLALLQATRFTQLSDPDWIYSEIQFDLLRC